MGNKVWPQRQALNILSLQTYISISVADPGCFIHPGSRIPDPTTETKRGGRKKIFLTFLWQKINKI
jgi:hypothetical protein